MFIVVCNVERSAERTDAQEKEAGYAPQPPQGGAGLHGTIAAAAQRGSERAGGSEEQRSIQKAKYHWQFGPTGQV